MRQQLRELSVTSRRPSIMQPAKSSSSAAEGISPTAACLRRLQLSQGNLELTPDKQSTLEGFKGMGQPNSKGGTNTVVQPTSPSRVWGGNTPPLHPSSPKGGLSALKKSLRWGQAAPQAISLSGSSPSGNVKAGLLSSSAHASASVQFSDLSRSVHMALMHNVSCSPKADAHLGCGLG